jgi:excisionase family DNA binding protein
MNSDLMTVREVAAALGVKPCTVRAFAERGALPRICLSARTHRWRRRDVAAFLEARRT